MRTGWVARASAVSIAVTSVATAQPSPEPAWLPDTHRTQAALDTYVTGSFSTDIVAPMEASLRAEVLPHGFLELRVPWATAQPSEGAQLVAQCGPGGGCFQPFDAAVAGLGNPNVGIRYADLHGQLAWSVGLGFAIPAGDVDDVPWRAALGLAQIATMDFDAHLWSRDTIAPWLSWSLDHRTHPWLSLQLGGELIRHLPTRGALPSFSLDRFRIRPPLQRHAWGLQGRVGAAFRHSTGWGARLHALTVLAPGEGGLRSFDCDTNRYCIDTGRYRVPGTPDLTLAFEPAATFDSRSWFVRAAVRVGVPREFADGGTLKEARVTGRLTFGAHWSLGWRRQ